MSGVARGIATAAGSLLLVVLAACGEEGETPVVAEELARMGADNVVYGMTQVLTNQGIREGVVLADTAYFYRDSSAVQLRSLDMYIYDEDGRERARIEANRGRLEGDTRSMVARGDVVLRIPAENRRVETSELHYSSGQDRIWSDSATVMVDDGEVSCGTAFESDLQFRNLTIEEARTTGCDELR
ncbi:MAG: LPS export ABC transporter periplasmic protein LptC [Longimicrobiales bacterium]|nr:LPS export ABC transporter periplasmic protein LptC [Longimicrobiales bacterium]